MVVGYAAEPDALRCILVTCAVVSLDHANAMVPVVPTVGVAVKLVGTEGVL